MSALPTCVNDPSADLQSRFISVLPRIKDQARFYFRSIKCVVHRAECIAETIGVAWKWFCRLAKKGKDATKFASALARLAARAVRGGRRVGAGETANDVMSVIAQRRHNFLVEPLPSPRTSQEILYDVGGQRMHDIMEERLSDNTVASPADQAAFRLDFRGWLRTLSARERRIIQGMAQNERTKELSRRFRVSPGRVSQMRREFQTDWRKFVGEIEQKVTG
jgi:hypothetical protein